MLDFTYPRYKVERDPNQCIQCGVCARQCANEVHMVDTDLGRVIADHKKCVNCQRCVVMCPTNALAITNWPQVGNGSNNWNLAAMQDIANRRCAAFFHGKPPALSDLLGPSAAQREPGY